MNDLDFLPLNKKTAKENIRKKMRDKGLSQKSVYERMGITQGDFSNCTNIKSDKFFTLDRLWELSQILDCSIDEILGKNDIPKVKPDFKNISLSDVCSALAYFNEIVRPEFQLKKENETVTVFLYSKIPAVNKLFKKFAEIKDDAELLSYYVQGFIRDHKTAIRKYNFQTEYECAKQFLDWWINSLYGYAEVYRQDTGNDIYHGGRNVESFKNESERIYLSELKKNCLQLMYDNVDRFIKEKDYFTSSPEYISLMRFKELHKKHYLKK